MKVRVGPYNVPVEGREVIYFNYEALMKVMGKEYMVLTEGPDLDAINFAAADDPSALISEVCGNVDINKICGKLKLKSYVRNGEALYLNGEVTPAGPQKDLLSDLLGTEVNFSVRAEVQHSDVYEVNKIICFEIQPKL